MSLGLVGRKVGMTRIFTDDGASVPVTVLEMSNNRVTQVRTPENDGYSAVQVAYGSRRNSRVNKAEAGHFAKAGVDAGEMLREFRVSADVASQYQPGAVVSVDLFQAGQKVDVTGTTIGKGFAGTIKRHHFRSQRATHGNSLSHRAPGSIGQNQSPGRVFKGKKMAGHLGAARRCVQNLEVVRVDVERNLLAIKGAVPGAKGGDVMIKPAVKVRR